MSLTHSDKHAEQPSSRRPVRCAGGLFRADLKAHLDGEISTVRNALVRWHLAQCAECREELRWLRRLGEDMQDIESARPRPELRARIMAGLPSTPPAPGIRVVHSRPERSRASRLAPRLALAGGAAMLLAFSGVFALKRTSGRAFDPAQAAAKPPIHAGTELAAEAPGAPGVMDTVTYRPDDDPNNAAADRLFHESMAALEREKLVRGQDDWHRLLAQARAAALKTNPTEPTEMGIALSVPNIAAVRTHLPTWAKQEGARLVTNGDPRTLPAESANLLPGRDEETSHNLVAFYVPAERGPAFLGALKQLGQLSILPLAPRPTADAPSSTAAVQPELNADRTHKAVPIMPTASDPGVSPDRIVVHDRRPKPARYLVLTVLLQPAVHN